MNESHVVIKHHVDDGTAQVSKLQLVRLVEYNNLLPRDKHSALYVTSRYLYNSQSNQLYVFRPLDQAEKWFFKRMIWPKLRKSPTYNTDFHCGILHCFMFHQEYVDISHKDEGGSDVFTRATKIFKKYSDSAHGLCFQNEPIPRKFHSKATVMSPETSRFNANYDAKAPTEGSRRRRRQPRSLPRDRDQDMILKWARMLAQEVDLDVSKGVPRPGGKFLLQFAQPQTLPPIHGHDTLQMMIHKQTIWAGRLSRMVNQLPEALNRQRGLRDQAWREGLPWIQRWFGVDAISPEGDELRQSFHRWRNAMKWMTGWSFDAFDSKPVFSYGMDDWLQCITNNVAIHQWGLEEEKQLGQFSGPDAILVKMIKSQTRWELTRGMEPLLEQMYEAAETEVHEWKSLCQGAVDTGAMA